MVVENWQQIKCFPNYQVSDLGNVKNKTTNKNIAKWRKSNGYLQVTLHSNGMKKNVYIHRLVAEAFIPNPDNLTDVNHKDENKTNNTVNNLEWMTHLNNCNYGNRGKKNIFSSVQTSCSNELIRKANS